MAFGAPGALSSTFRDIFLLFHDIEDTKNLFSQLSFIYYLLFADSFLSVRQTENYPQYGQFSVHCLCLKNVAHQATKRGPQHTLQPLLSRKLSRSMAETLCQCAQIASKLQKMKMSPAGRQNRPLFVLQKCRSPGDHTSLRLCIAKKQGRSARCSLLFSLSSRVKVPDHPCP